MAGCDDCGLTPRPKAMDQLRQQARGDRDTPTSAALMERHAPRLPPRHTLNSKAMAALRTQAGGKQR